mmetsp:Transcript_832/g.1732  ORF Transcript_832/g.1732 Transcript_832/m.1732 type:complete len:89 (-) Transcript_832:74-340(-)
MLSPQKQVFASSLSIRGEKGMLNMFWPIDLVWNSNRTEMRISVTETNEFWLIFQEQGSCREVLGELQLVPLGPRVMTQGSQSKLDQIC